MARQQARLGSCRLGAVRLGDFFPSVRLFIGSLASYRPGAAQGVMIDPSLSIDESIEDVPRRATFQLRDAVTSPPQPGQAITIALGSNDNPIFGGHIISAEQSHRNRYVEPPVFTVKAEDNRRLLNRRRITARFLSTDAADIIRTLIVSYTSGFTAAAVRGTLGQIDEIEFTNEEVSAAITRVMKRVGGRWYLDARKDVHAFTGEELGLSPAADLLVTSKQKSWKHVRDISQVRTKVVVKGGGTTTTTQNIAGTTLFFVNETALLNGAATITVGGGLYSVASVSPSDFGSPFFVVLANSLSLGGLGLGPGGYDTDKSTVAGAPVNVYAVAQSTTLQNSIAAIEGGDGVHEYFITDGRMTQAGALQRAQSELTLFGSIEHRGTYATRDPSAQAGRMLAINAASPVHLSSVSARIQRVTVTGFEESGRSWSSTHAHYFPLRSVEYSSGAIRDVFEIMGDFERGI